MALFPQVYPKKDNGSTYAAINECLRNLAGTLETDLWTLDALWWGLAPNRSEKLIQHLFLL
ncbi:MAG: hypothetical protein IIA40_03785 [SAR324 cluster bacterium]|nr:hypothetical protein [SAR324 cluster bacterium]